MNYIVNPMWFYWMDVLSDLDLISAILFGISSVGLIVLIIFGYDMKIDNAKYGEDDGDYKAGCKYLNLAKKFAPFVIIFFLLTVFIPDKETLAEMLVAKMATVEQACIDGKISENDIIGLNIAFTQNLENEGVLEILDGIGGYFWSCSTKTQPEFGSCITEIEA